MPKNLALNIELDSIQLTKEVPLHVYAIQYKSGMYLTTKLQLAYTLADALKVFRDSDSKYETAKVVTWSEMPLIDLVAHAEKQFPKKLAPQMEEK